MTFTNTLVKLVLVQFALYAPLVTTVSVFDGFVCGFRLWPNFFAVLQFWMIFSFGFAVSNIPQCPPLDCSGRKIYPWIRLSTCANRVRLQTSRSSRFSTKASSRMKSFIQSKTKVKRRPRNQDLQIQTRPLKVQRKRRNASFVVRPNGIQSPPIAQLMASNVEFVR